MRQRMPQFKTNCGIFIGGNSHNQIAKQTGRILDSRHVKQGHDKITNGNGVSQRADVQILWQSPRQTACPDSAGRGAGIQGQFPPPDSAVQSEDLDALAAPAPGCRGHDARQLPDVGILPLKIVRAGALK